jgi:hypothetical protein
MALNCMNAFPVEDVRDIRSGDGAEGSPCRRKTLLGWMYLPWPAPTHTSNKQTFM